MALACLETRATVPCFDQMDYCAAILALSPLAVTTVLLGQAGDMMFEKDFYTIAIIDGLLPGAIFGVSLGIAIKTLVRKAPSKMDTP